MSEMPLVAPHLFDTLHPHAGAESDSAGVAPDSVAQVEPRFSVRLRWGFGLVAGVFGAAISLLFRWPIELLVLTSALFATTSATSTG
jgi:hypothetical protein